MLPPAFFVALAILSLSCCILIFQQRVPTWVFVLHVLCFIVFVHGSPSLLYGYEDLRYSWAWKHGGVIDYVSSQPVEEVLQDAVNVVTLQGGTP